jgi:restriction system protein
MTIPDFQSLMLPLLRFYADGKEHANRESTDYLADKLSITPEERKELLPSGRAPVLDNRIAWARTHLKAANLLENTRRGAFRISDRGKEILRSKPEKINMNFLMQFPEYAERRETHRRNYEKRHVLAPENVSEPKTTPEEQIEEAYENLRNNLADEILSQLRGSSSSFFERVVVEVLVKMGYGGSLKDAGQAIGKSGDEGIDGIINEYRLGLDIIYIQAKKWEGSVSRPEIQKFAGALQGKRARKGIFITTSDFSQSAREYVSAIDSKIILID